LDWIGYIVFLELKGVSGKRYEEDIQRSIKEGGDRRERE
jgi:hypothetical protein